jgi:hypothetical protein
MEFRTTSPYLLFLLKYSSAQSTILFIPSFDWWNSFQTVPKCDANPNTNPKATVESAEVNVSVAVAEFEAKLESISI